MTQAEVLKFLRKNPDKWFLAEEIAKKLRNLQGINTIRANLSRLFKQNEVFRKEKTNYYRKRYYVWKFKG